MRNPDWRSADDYRDLLSLDAPGFAWQFLRRNPVFRQEWQTLKATADRGTLSQADADTFAAKWGVRVRKEQLRLRNPCSPLDGGDLAECGDDHFDTP